jgi:hypothetical protein
MNGNEMIQDTKLSKKTLTSFGFKFGNRGVHSSRTIMLKDLNILLDCVEPNAQHCDYLKAIEFDNSLGKKTVSTRRISAQKLTSLYSLSPEIVLFKSLRSLYYIDRTSIPMLAMLCSIARDPLLFVSVSPITQISIGKQITKQFILETLKIKFKDLFKESTFNSMVRNILSSWTQSGHLKGHLNKVRVRPRITPTVACYALLLGYLSGLNGQPLFDSIWAKVCDISNDEMISLAQKASRQGLMNFKMAGDIMECRFPNLLTPKEEKLINGQN